jgi:hypothetical protein
MRQREFTEDGPAGGRQPYPDLAFIPGAGVSGDGAVVLQPVYEFDCAVMLDE